MKKLTWIIIIISLAFLPALAKEKAWIVGKVTDEKTGAGIPGVRVVVFLQLETYTEENGAFQFRDIRPGGHSYLEFYPAGSYCAFSRQMIIPHEGENVVNYALGSGGSLKGSVYLSKGQPFENAKVTVSGPGGSVTVETKDNGSFLIDRLCPGDAYYLKVEHKMPGLSFRFHKDITIEKGACTVLNDFFLDSDSDTGVEGIVTSSLDGKPLPGVLIDLLYIHLCNHCGQMEYGQTRTNSQGYFQIKNIANAGEFYIIARIAADRYRMNRETGKREYLPFNSNCYKELERFIITKGSITKVSFSMDVPSYIFVSPENSKECY